MNIQQIISQWSFASHFIGYTKAANPDDDKETNRAMGLEQTYNDILSGTDGRVYFEKDVMAMPYQELWRKRKKQWMVKIFTRRWIVACKIPTLEDLMTQVNEKYEPVSMTAMLMEAKTGRKLLPCLNGQHLNPETKQGLDDNGTWQEPIS